MPFVCKSGHKVATINNSNDLPVFIIPGILGTGEDVQPLVDKLNLLNKRRPIFVYEDPRVKSPDAYAFKKSIDEQVNDIINEVKEIVPKPAKFFPFYILGYSYGGILATLAAQKFIEENQEKKTEYRPNIYVIDNPTPHLFKEHYTNNRDELPEYIQKIVNAASLLNKREYVRLSEAEIDMIKTGSIEEQAYYLKMKLWEKIDELSRPLFENKIAIAIENINYLLQFDSPHANKLDTKKLENLFLLVTNEVKNLFGAEKISDAWLDHTKQLISIINEDLQSQTHFEIIKNNKLAWSICDFFTETVPAVDYLTELDELHKLQKTEAVKKGKKRLSDDEYNALGDTPSDTPTSLEENSDSSDSNLSTSPQLSPTLERRKISSLKKHTIFNVFNNESNKLSNLGISVKNFFPLTS